MAHLTIDYFSRALHRRASFEMELPNDLREGEMPSTLPRRVVFNLHGYTGKAENMVPEDLARKYNIAVVMPNGENAFYLNGISTGHAFQTLVGEELVDYVRATFGLALHREDTAIMGLSMGGFGALHTALAYPEVFGKAAALSSALIVHGIAHMQPGQDNGVANYEYYRECFGDLETVEQRDVNPEVLAHRLKAAGGPLPEIYMSCGTEDFLLENNRQMHRFLTEEGIPHTYTEGPGKHDMDFWRPQFVKAVTWMFGA